MTPSPSPSSDELPLSTESVEWMQALARGHEPGEWVCADAAWPSECFAALVWMQMVERAGDEARFRLTDLGWWALGNVVKAVD